MIKEKGMLLFLGHNSELTEIPDNSITVNEYVFKIQFIDKEDLGESSEVEFSTIENGTCYYEAKYSNDTLENILVSKIKQKQQEENMIGKMLSQIAVAAIVPVAKEAIQKTTPIIIDKVTEVKNFFAKTKEPDRKKHVITRDQWRKENFPVIYDVVTDYIEGKKQNKFVEYNGIKYTTRELYLKTVIKDKLNVDLSSSSIMRIYQQGIDNDWSIDSEPEEPYVNNVSNLF